MRKGVAIVLSFAALAAVAFTLIVLHDVRTVRGFDSHYVHDCDNEALPSGRFDLQSEGIRWMTPTDPQRNSLLRDLQRQLMERRFTFVEVAAPVPRELMPERADPAAPLVRFFLADAGDARCAGYYRHLTRERATPPLPGGMCIAAEADTRSLARYAIQDERFTSRNGFKGNRRFVLDQTDGRRVAVVGNIVWPNRNRFSAPNCGTKSTQGHRWLAINKLNGEWVAGAGGGDWLTARRLPQDSAVARFYRVSALAQQKPSEPLVLDTALSDAHPALVEDRVLPGAIDLYTFSLRYRTRNIDGAEGVFAPGCYSDVCLTLVDAAGRVRGGSLLPNLPSRDAGDVEWVSELDGRVLAVAFNRDHPLAAARPVTPSFWIFEVARDGRIVVARKVWLEDAFAPLLKHLQIAAVATDARNYRVEFLALRQGERPTPERDLFMLRRIVFDVPRGEIDAGRGDGNGVGMPDSAP